jgi:glycosyltransferase involved in cell wall biosynthesis
MSEEKGFWDCVSITRTLLTKDWKMNAIFLGPITDPVIFQATEKLKRDFRNRFEHIGPYDSVTLSKNLQDSTYFLFPSRYSNEASPLVVLEAQALGNVCITSDVGTLHTDVLPPGAAVGMETWLAKALEVIQQNKSDLPTTKLISETIKQKSALLAVDCTNQMKEVFNL